MNFRAPSYPTLAAIAYAVFAVFGIATWYTLLFLAVPERTSSLKHLGELLALEPGGSLLALHALATLAAVAFAAVLARLPLVTHRSRLTAALASLVFAFSAWALYRSDTALLPAIGAFVLVWHYFKPSAPSSEA